MKTKPLEALAIDSAGLSIRVIRPKPWSTLLPLALLSGIPRKATTERMNTTG